MSTITVTFDPPSPSDSPSVFNTKAFATLGDLNTWSTQANTVAGEVNTNASTASTAASTATTQASNASTSASNASTSASNASTSASTASTAASTATTQAGIATTKASEAAASAAETAVYKQIPQNSKSTSYTLVLADAGYHIYMTSSGTVTIPANSSVAFPIGTAVTVVNAASAVSIACSDTLRLAPVGTTGTRTLAAYGVATALKIAATEWRISGSGLT